MDYVAYLDHQDNQVYQDALDDNQDPYEVEIAGVNHTLEHDAINHRETLSQNRGQADYDLTVALPASEQIDRTRRQSQATGLYRCSGSRKTTAA